MAEKVKGLKGIYHNEVRNTFYGMITKSGVYYRTKAFDTEGRAQRAYFNLRNDLNLDGLSDIDIECNLCFKKMKVANKFIRFCEPCKNGNESYRNFNEDYEVGT